MTKQQLNVRIPNLTRRQLDRIAQLETMTLGEIVTLAVDRMWREYVANDFQLDGEEDESAQ